MARIVRPRHPLLALALLLPVPSLSAAAGLIWWPETVLGKGLFLAGKIWICLLPAVWHVWVDRGRLSWSRPREGGFGTGLLTGLAIASVIFAAYFLYARHVIDPQAVRAMAARAGLDRPGVFLAMAIYWTTVNSILEEYVWRWFVVTQAAAVVFRPAAIVISAAGFVVHHVVTMQVYFPWPLVTLAAVGIGVGGMLWSWMYLRYRSVWPGYLSHALVDAAVFTIGWMLIFG